MPAFDCIDKKLLLISLNELNFDCVDNYLVKYPDRFSGFKKLSQLKKIITTSEERYDLLEPWIQWPSVYMGLSYNEHKIFRLGDIKFSHRIQIFEAIEALGYRVGCVAPMNAANRLRDPAYFISDPWTRTLSDGSFFGRNLSDAISQAVNDNASSRVTIKTILIVILSLARFAKFKHYSTYIKLLVTSRKASWRKALMLDLLMADIHSYYFLKKNVNFSNLFLNAGAHIQHHYFFNALHSGFQKKIKNPAWYLGANNDPFFEMLDVYDKIIIDILDNIDAEKIFATGLTQIPYDRIKFYWRLTNHEEFLGALNIKYHSVNPRMTRDFLVEFDTQEDTIKAYRVLASLHVLKDNLPLFGEIDIRDKSLFVTLTYPGEIDENTEILNNEIKIKIAPFVSFVAIKNGMHDAKGFSFYSKYISEFSPKNHDNIKQIYFSIIKFFDRQTRNA